MSYVRVFRFSSVTREHSPAAAMNFSVVRYIRLAQYTGVAYSSRARRRTKRQRCIAFITRRRRLSFIVTGNARVPVIYSRVRVWRARAAQLCGRRIRTWLLTAYSIKHCFDGRTVSFRHFSSRSPRRHVCRAGQVLKTIFFSLVFEIFQHNYQYIYIYFFFHFLIWFSTVLRGFVRIYCIFHVSRLICSTLQVNIEKKLILKLLIFFGVKMFT